MLWPWLEEGYGTTNEGDGQTRPGVPFNPEEEIPLTRLRGV